MSAIDRIEQALTAAKQAGIKIVPGACSRWDKNNLLEVNWAGAVLYHNNIDSRTKGSFKKLLDILNVGEWWFHDFMVGFDQNHTVDIVDDKEHVIGTTKASTQGKQIRHAYYQNQKS